MDIRQLQVFVQVAELGSFTRAATVLGVAQPALSRHVRTLEVELRQSLFERHGRGVALTSAGQRLLAHARGILQQLERARADMEAQRGGITGLLSVGLPPSLSRTLTATLVDAFAQRFPRAGISVVEGLSTTLGEWLLQGRVDCAVVYNAVPGAALQLQPVLQERLYLVSAPPADEPAAGRVARQPVPARVGKPVTLAELAQQRLVIPSRPHALRMRLETVLAEAGLKPQVALEVDSVPALLELVRRHPLHAVLSLNALRGASPGPAYLAQPVRLPQPAGGYLHTSLWLATSAQRPRGALLDQACALLTALLVEALAG